MLILPTRRIAGSERFNGTTSKAALTGGGVEQESGRATTVLAHVYKHGTGEGATGTIYSRSSGTTQYLTLSINPSNGRGFRFAAHSSGSGGAPHINTEDRMVTTGREWQHVAATWTGDLAASSMQAFVARDGEPLSRSVSGSQGGTTAVLDSGSATLNIGNRDDSARTWDGWIHYVARWDRVLDLSELLLAQRYGPEAVPNGLVMLYRDGRDWSPSGLSVTRTDIRGGPAPSVRSMARRVPVFAATGGPAADLESDATGSGSAAGDLTTAIQLVGAAVATGAAAGDLATAVQLAGAAAAAAGASGALSTGIPLAGAAASVTLSGGALTTVIRLDGDALSSALASGTLDSGSAALAGDAQAAGAATGGLTTIIVLQGAAVGGALAAADLAAPGTGLSGAATAGALASGALTTQIPLAGGAQATVIASGEASTSISLAGAAVGVVSATGDLVVALGLSADAVAAALAGASLTTSVTLRADAVAGAQAGGSLAGVIYIASARRTARVAARVRVAAVARRVRTQRVGVFA